MAIATTAVCEIRPTAGNDASGGLFDPAMTGMDATLAGTSATGSTPSLTSTNISSVAGDVGNAIFIQSGTNWVPGWYPITSQSAGAWVVNAAIGAVNLYKPTPAAGLYTYAANTSAGIATTASPTSGTWTIDYSQANAANQSFTGESSSTTTVTCTSGVVTVAWIGNSIYISAGTGATVARYMVTAVGTLTSGFALTFTIDRSAGATGTGVAFALGGALATNNEAFNTAHSGGAGTLNSLTFWLKASGTQLVGGAQTAIPAGAANALFTTLIGYNSMRGDLDAVRTFTNFPLIQGNNVNSTCIACSSADVIIRNIACDGGSGGTKTAICFTLSGASTMVVNCKATGFTSIGMSVSGGNNRVEKCYVTSCVSGATAGINSSSSQIKVTDCVVVGNTAGTTCIGISSSNTIGSTYERCIVANNTGSAADGMQFSASGGNLIIENCTIYGNGRDGIRGSAANAFDYCLIQGNVIWGNGAYGINSTVTDYSKNPYQSLMDYNFIGGNTSGSYLNVSAGQHDVALTVDPTTAGASNNFALNNTAGGGTLVRAADYPGVFSGISTTGYLDGGAVQHQDPASTGGGAQVIGC